MATAEASIQLSHNQWWKTNFCCLTKEPEFVEASDKTDYNQDVLT